MRAAVFVNGEVRVEDRPAPEPGTGELLVAVRSAGLNGADLLQQRGLYPPPAGVPEDRPGMELAGTVQAVGDRVTRFAVGDAVMGIVPGCAQAELAVIHERVAMPVPASLPLAVAGGFPEVFVTAHDALVTRCDLRSGERLLVTGAAGGVGTAAVQLGAALGATVVAEVRSEDQREGVAALGATVAGPGEVHQLGPFDVILELVGAPNLAADLKSLDTGGRIIAIGVGGGAIADVDLRVLMQRRAQLLGATMRNRPLEEKALVARAVERHVLPLVERGQVGVLVEASFPLEQAPLAYERFAAGGKLGKILIAVR